MNVKKQFGLFGRHGEMGGLIDLNSNIEFKIKLEVPFFDTEKEAEEFVDKYEELLFNDFRSIIIIPVWNKVK